MEIMGARYGCVFCRTGAETIIAQWLRDQGVCLHATPAYRMEYRSKSGVKTQVKAILLPGYVFFIAEEEMESFRVRMLPGALRVLSDDARIWHLHGDDEAFARWVFEHDGLIGMSKALETGDRVRIISGPMKDYEGSIIKIDRRAKSGIIAIPFDNRTLNLRLSFEITEAIK